jgi:hypothetical protein
MEPTISTDDLFLMEAPLDPVEKGICGERVDIQSKPSGCSLTLAFGAWQVEVTKAKTDRDRPPDLFDR